MVSLNLDDIVIQLLETIAYLDLSKYVVSSFFNVDLNIKLLAVFNNQFLYFVD